MAKLIVRNPSETFLTLADPESGLFPLNHIFEPEFHQAEYVEPCERLAGVKGAYQLGECSDLADTIRRGVQPKYSDDEDDPESLRWRGMMMGDGSNVPISDKTANICALKSICIRYGYLDLETARSVSVEFFDKVKNRASVKKNDILINSTGDGTIGRVTVFNYDFPAVVDGHVTIVRLSDSDLAWYVAAFLLSEDGQKQIIRYINGSSGQVEIYPQDIARLWIKPAGKKKIEQIGQLFKEACDKHKLFRQELKSALSQV